MKRKRLSILILCAALMLGCCAALTLTGGEAKPRHEDASAEMARLLGDLVSACDEPGADAERAVREDLLAIRALNEGDYEIACAVAEHWQRAFLDPDCRLCLYDGGERATSLEPGGIPNSPTHAIVVLGYQLLDGEMQPELKGRCEAAAALARSFPDTVMVCTGGPTGANNPERHTEAGMMKAYLTEVCGIDPARIFTDEEALSTAENAVNTMEILREKGVRTMTVVTSSYHQRWGEAVYNAAAAAEKQRSGWSVALVGSFSFKADGAAFAHREARIAASQIAEILGLPPGTPRS